jgi:peptide/nickel transport system ATP-binding protein
MTKAILTVEGLSKRFSSATREIVALQNIAFTVSQGEFLGITGPSGCGKSTLARCILRLIEPDDGKIWIDGRDWLQLSPRKLRHSRRDIQMVFQNSSQSFNRFATVQEVITEPLRIHSIVAQPQYLAHSADLLERVGLSAELLPRHVASLSGGQRQRVAIARAIASRPKLLILDEAVSALDMIAKQKILELLASLQKDMGLSALFIAHDFAAIKALCHRTAIMDAGQIIEEGITSQLIAQPQAQLTRSLLQAVPSLNI